MENEGREESLILVLGKEFFVQDIRVDGRAGGNQRPPDILPFLVIYEHFARAPFEQFFDLFGSLIRVEQSYIDPKP
jgi:hypothetical protein